MEVVFVDWSPINSKSEIYKGGHIRRYYAWITLNKMVDVVIPFRKENGSINWNAICCMFNKNSEIWVEYGSGRVAHFFVLLASYVRSKQIILNVHDFAVEQRKSIGGKIPFVKKLEIQILERLLLQRAKVIILSCPGLLDYFTPKSDQMILIMVPGVGEDEIETSRLILSYPKSKQKRKIAMYFGSMNQGGTIPEIAELFSKLDDWELHLIGLEEGEEIVSMKNVKYFGSLDHASVQICPKNADAILIPYPNEDYFNKAMPIKLGYTLKTCKPVISTDLKGILEYVSRLELEHNVVFVKEWNFDNLKDALQMAQGINIDPRITLEKLESVAWEPRFRKVIEIAFALHHETYKVKWI